MTTYEAGTYAAAIKALDEAKDSLTTITLAYIEHLVLGSYPDARRLTVGLEHDEDGRLVLGSMCIECGDPDGDDFAEHTTENTPNSDVFPSIHSALDRLLDLGELAYDHTMNGNEFTIALVDA